MSGVLFAPCHRVGVRRVLIVLFSVVWLLPALPVAGALPGGVTHRLRQADRALQRGEKMLTAEAERYDLDYRVKTARAAVKSARGTMEEIEKRYGSKLPDPCPETQAMTARIDKLEKDTDALERGAAQAEAQAQADAAAAAGASESWLAKLKPYVTGLGQSGYDAERYLIPSATMEEKEMQKRLQIYAQACADWAAYLKADFSAGKTDELKEIAEKLRRELDTFKASCVEYAQQNVAKAQTDLKYAADFLAKQEAKAGTDQTPLTLQKLQLRTLRGTIDYLAVLADPNDKDVLALNKSYAELLQRDEKIRKLRIAQTRMIADKYKGKDARTLKQTAQKIVKTKFRRATILRTTLISADWTEQRVFEFTDTTHTAVRYRVTRSVTAQVAARVGKDVSLYTLDISKDRRSDGSWGPLYGHIMFTDPMLAENVMK